jgi:hypothetical protein
MRLRNVFAAVVFLAAPALFAQSLSVVEVQAPNVNFVFNPTGKVTVQDLASPIWTGGFLQSRNFQGVAGAPAAGLYAYEYRIDLRNVVGITVIQQIFSMTIDIGPTVKLDFNGDQKPDDVFVVTKGGLGNVKLKSAVRSGNQITFTFDGSVGGGSAPGKGDSSYFFGVVSKYPRRNVTVSPANNLGANLLLKAWAPNHP